MFALAGLVSCLALSLHAQINKGLTVKPTGGMKAGIGGLPKAFVSEPPIPAQAPEARSNGSIVEGLQRMQSAASQQTLEAALPRHMARSAAFLTDFGGGTSSRMARSAAFEPGNSRDKTNARAGLDASFDGESPGRVDLPAYVLLNIFSERTPRAGKPKLPKAFLPLPLIKQKTKYSCGPAVLLSVLRYWQGYRGSERSLYSILKTTRKDGTEPRMLAFAARKFGLRAAIKEDLKLSDLRKALKEGKTAILNIQAWRSEAAEMGPWRDVWDDGHYVVLVGMDRRYAYVMDSSLGGYGYLPLKELQERWHDFEDRRGRREIHNRLAVFISGGSPPVARVSLSVRPGPR